MSEWIVKYWAEHDGKPPVEEWLDALTTEQLKAVSKEIMLLGHSGNRLRLPHSKALEDGLFELREMRFGLRIYYTFHKGKIIILLCAGNKKTQTRDIKTARTRMTKLSSMEIKNESKKF